MLPIIFSVCGASLIGLLIYGITHQAASRTLDDAVAQRQWPLAPQPNHRLLALTAGASSSDLATHRGQVVILNFWASWCQPCEDEAPLLQREQPALLSHHATVLGVTYKDLTVDSQSFIRRFHLTYPNLRDANGSFAEAYGTDQLPESFLIDREGRVRAIERGAIGGAFLKRALALALEP